MRLKPLFGVRVDSENVLEDRKVCVKFAVNQGKLVKIKMRKAGDVVGDLEGVFKNYISRAAVAPSGISDTERASSRKITGAIYAAPKYNFAPANIRSMLKIFQRAPSKHFAGKCTGGEIVTNK